MKPEMITALRSLYERSKGDNGAEACVELHRMLFPDGWVELLDAADEMIEILMDISNWAYSIHSDAYPIKMARELLARQDALGGWNKL
jgi:hypothetical protein